ncbi:MAG: hypothetical protein AAF494_07885 [Pseudomonadota bacterium]
MQKSILMAASMALAAGFVVAPAPVEAEQFKGLGKKLKKAKKKAEEAEQAVETVDAVVNGRGVGVGASADGSNCNANRGSNSNSPCTAKGKGHAGRAGPAPAKYTSLTKCAGIPIKNAFIGQYGDYTFSSGLNTEERRGIINREPVSPSGGCIMPSMGTYDVLYIEVPTAQLNSLKGGYEMQCINTSTGKQANDEARPRWYNTSGKDIMLHTGHSLGYTPTASGSNSDRTAAWEKDLKRRGMSMFGFNMPNLHTDGGTDFYCQYYNSASGKSVVAFQYRRSAG